MGLFNGEDESNVYGVQRVSGLGVMCIPRLFILIAFWFVVYAWS